MADCSHIRACYHLETDYSNVVFFSYQLYSLSSCTKALVELEMCERRAAGMIQKVWNVFCLGNYWVHQTPLSGKEMTEVGCGKRATKAWEIWRVGRIRCLLFFLTQGLGRVGNHMKQQEPNLKTDDCSSHCILQVVSSHCKLWAPVQRMLSGC